MSLLNQDVKVIWSDLKRAFAAIKPRQVEELSMSLVVTLFLVLAFGTHIINGNTSKAQYATAYLAQNTIPANNIITPAVSGVVLGEQTGSGELTQPQIDAILSLLRSFNASDDVVNNVSTVLTGKQFSTAVRFCHAFARNIRIGDRGEDVTALQKVLKTEGFDITDDQGVFDESTASAVVGFQEKYSDEVLRPAGLSRGTGFAGSATRAKLNALYGCGTTNTTHPSITVLSPNGGETWQWGQNYQITWASNPAGTVVDVYYVSATLGTQYAAIRNLTGQNNITVVAGLLYINGDGSKVYLSADSYKIKVCVTNTNTCDTSDSSFTIPNQTKPSITVLSPNGGEMWFEGTTQVIKWSAKLTTNIYGQQYTPSVFYIEALNQDKDAGTYTIAEASSYGSSYNWEVGTYTDGIASTRRMLPRGQYLVRVCEARTTNCDSSDSYFTITSPTTQPSTGTVLGEQTSASTLTQLQIDAIITLLRSLGVEQGALNNVDTSLHGGTPAF